MEAPYPQQFATDSYPQNPVYSTSMEAMAPPPPMSYAAPPPVNTMSYQAPPTLSVPHGTDVITYDIANSMHNKPIVPTILSLLIPGLGNLLISQTKKGVYFLMMAFIITFVNYNAFIFSVMLFPLFLIFFLMVIGYVIFNILVAVDVYKCALKLKENEHLYEGECSNKYVAKFTSLQAVMGKRMKVFVTGSPEDPRGAASQQ